MFAVDKLIFVGALLLLVAIVARRVTARSGVPVLVVFIFLGMLAGSEGVGGIAFENYELAHGIGTLALAIILFNGGLRTPWTQVQAGWKPALSLATAGVVLTAGITGLAASYALGLTLLQGLLLGSIVASTDAAAVFSVLNSQGVSLPGRLSATLELESGSNDPMAVFLTIGLVEVVGGTRGLGGDLLFLFAMQIGLGGLVGLAVGRGSAWLINRINMDAAGLYPLLAGLCGLLAYGLAATLGGSGFLAVYLTGVVLGNSALIFQQGILHFHDTAAWLCQAGMFVLLGLLSFPSALADVAGQGLAVALVLILVARPVAVLVGLAPFGFRWRELLFLSWVGLRGAVPIILATFPLLFGLEHSQQMFNVVFFVVLVSALVQGWSLSWVARRLGVQVPGQSAPPVSLEIAALRHIDVDIVDYPVQEQSRVAGKSLRNLGLPEETVVAIIARGDDIIPPRGSTTVEAEDHVFVVLRPEQREAVSRVFGDEGAAAPAVPTVELPGTLTVGELAERYGCSLPASACRTLDEFVREACSGVPDEGRRIEVGGNALVVLDVEEKHVERLRLEPIPRSKPPAQASAETSSPVA